MARLSFNRRRDSDKITTHTLCWQGPFCMSGFEKETNLTSISDTSGIYLFCFEYLDGFVLHYAGVSKSIKKRIATHLREYRNGNYNILDLDAIKTCERVEIWHGWVDGKKNREEFERNYNFYSQAIEKQLLSYRIFFAEENDARKRFRVEAAIILNAYVSKEPWSDLVPRWMQLNGRWTDEIPIDIINNCGSKIYGLPDCIEI